MKKIHAIVFLLICSLASLSAESVKHYTNKAKGYDGWVTVEVMGNTAEYEAEGYEEEFISILKETYVSNFQEIEELDEETQWLVDKAISDAKGKKGDIILLLCSDQEEPEEGTFVITIITSGSKDYLWCAFYVDEESVNSSF
ncbi:MAG TPA: hypothetical protein DCQ43_03745 [Treponema sp.]|nr:hypothetical protein [Treponema sp.]